MRAALSRAVAILAGLALATGAVALLARARAGGLPLDLARPGAASWYEQRPDLVLLALGSVLALAASVFAVGGALAGQDRLARRIVAASVGALLVVGGALVALFGLWGVVDFAQHDSPADDFAAMIYLPRIGQMLAGGLVALVGLLSLWMARRRHVQSISQEIRA